ncbi:MAG TPA: NADPH-dependent FMN reductase [Polyangiaceae bacterium]|jgi:NAD(P)H-dependent FMN reductase|nr:NADPH-dependent FMN reductase [Polyangiaceae bacterium]
MRVLSVCGSLQQKSANLTLLERAAVLAPAGVELQRYDGLRDLPHFNPDLEQNGPLPAVSALREAVQKSDALLIAMPEYGHSLPGALKNAIDWLIGTGELERKLCAITSSVPIAERGLRGLKALEDTLGAVSARMAFARPIVRGPAFDDDVSALLAALRARAAESREA